jgi:hypothetical protein
MYGIRLTQNYDFHIVFLCRLHQIVKKEISRKQRQNKNVKTRDPRVMMCCLFGWTLVIYRKKFVKSWM